MKKVLSGKVVLITGASRGIGQAAALAFAREGSLLALTYHTDEAPAKETAGECEKLGAKEVMVQKLDVRDNGNIKKAVEAVVKKFGRIDVLVNNAGVGVWKNLEEQTDDDIEYQLRTNLEGLIKMTLACLPHVKETIINISSGAGITAHAGLSVYSASKFGVRGFTQALSDERTDLKLYSVNPGMTATQMTNFRGVEPERVAEVIVNAAKGEYSVASGGDVNVWEHI